MSHKSAAVEARTSSASNEWYTPKPIVDKVREVLGGIDLDPASCPAANQVVKAAYYFQYNALKFTWNPTHFNPINPYRRVFLNPPYGRDKDTNKSLAGLFLQKMISEYDAGNFDEGIMLVNAAVGSEWFSPVYNYPLCFVDRRIRFTKPAGKSPLRSPTYGNVLIYFGTNFNHFDRVMDIRINPNGIGYVYPARHQGGENV